MNKKNLVFSKPIAWIISGCFAGAIGMAVLTRQGSSSVAQASKNNAVVEQVQTESLNLPALKDIDKLYVELAKKVTPSVVNIRVGSLSEKAKPEQQRGRRSQAEGSGVIIRSDGWIVTNAHVVGNAKKVVVTFSDGREVEGTVRSTNDPQVDVAVVKVSLDHLPVLKWGDSSAIEVGQMVMAIGSPLGLDNTVTFGRISAVRRGTMMAGDGSGSGQKVYSDMFQIDASINPGNSGGAACDFQGNLIGINTAIPGALGYNIGIGFAMKSRFVRFIADKLIATGKITRSYIGISPTDLKEYQKKELGADGALVESVVKGAPADNAGIKKGDIITKIGNMSVSDELGLRMALMEYAPGVTVKVEVKRGKKTLVLDLKTQGLPKAHVQKRPARRQWSWPSPFGGQDWPPFFGDFFGFPRGEQDDENESAPESEESEEQPEAKAEKAPEKSEKPVRLGVDVSDLTEALQTQYNIPAGTKGAIVVKVLPDSLASSIEITPGAVIQKVDHNKIANKSQLITIVKKIKKGETHTITYAKFGKGSRMQVTETIQF